MTARQKSQLNQRDEDTAKIRKERENARVELIKKAKKERKRVGASVSIKDLLGSQLWFEEKVFSWDIK